MGYYCYTFQNLCMENRKLALNDETVKIFFNTKGNLGEAPEPLRNFLRYVETKKAEDTFTRELDSEVERSKRNDGWRREYMKEILLYHDLKEEGRKEGKKEGLEEGRLDGIKALIETYQENSLGKEAAISQLMLKFALSKEQAQEYTGLYWK